MKIRVLFYAVLVTQFLTSNPLATDKNDSNSIDSMPKIKKAVQPRWFVPNPLLINMTETYSFDTSQEESIYGTQVYSFSNPNYNPITPRFTESEYDFSINSSCYTAYAYDSTNTRQNFNPAPSFMKWSGYVSNGKAYFGLDYLDMLSNRSKISNDSRKLNDTEGNLFKFKDSSINPKIGKGLVLYRSSSSGIFSGWDGYHPLDTFASTQLRIAFDEDLLCQVAVLYEIDNYDNGVWVFQKHQYYHVLGVYNFQTSSKLKNTAI